MSREGKMETDGGPASPATLTVVLVDDERESLELLQRTLRGRYRTLRAMNGREGLRCLELQPVAVVVADQRMPGMTGVEFLSEACRRHPKTQRILLTGYTEVDGLVDAINAGRVFGYLSKPWHPDDLLATVRRASETHELLRDREALLSDLREKNRTLHQLLERMRRLQSEKIQAERLAAIGKLSGMVAHDLRNPLAAIRCQAGLLGEGALTPDGRARSARAILQQTERMASYIDELLQFGRPGEQAEAYRAHPLGPLVGEVMAPFLARCDAKGVRLREAATFSGTVWGVRHQLHRVLQNLLENALDAVEARGEILLATAPAADGGVLIRIADSGPGVSPEVRDGLFEPFVTRGKAGGTGLGLAVVKKIVGEHGGRVWQEPWRLSGACFHVLLRSGPEGPGLPVGERAEGEG